MILQDFPRATARGNRRLHFLGRLSFAFQKKQYVGPRELCFYEGGLRAEFCPDGTSEIEEVRFRPGCVMTSIFRRMGMYHMKKSFRRICLSLGVLVSLASPTIAAAEDLFLASNVELPGKLWLSQGGTAERLIHARAGKADPAFPRAIMKLAQVAVSPDNKVYYCSGLDGSIMHLLNGRHEIQILEINGQIRDLACTNEPQTIYYSVVPTPQNGEPLADGAIYRRDMGEGSPTIVATIRQADVGGNWWGTFTISNGAIYISTLEDSSRIFRVAGDNASSFATANGFRIHGLSACGDGSFYFVNGSDKVFRTTNFAAAESVLATIRRFSDVALRTLADSPRP